MDIEEEIKIVEMAKNDLKAFEQLYELYVRKIYSYVASMVGNNVDAEDIVSETFEKAMLNIDKYEYRGYTFGAWLYRIARNLVYDRSRNKKVVQMPDQEFVSNEVDLEPEISFEKGAQSEYLLELLGQLNEDQREIVILRYMQGYSINEVSDMLDKTEDSIKSLAKRALQNLRELNERNI